MVNFQHNFNVKFLRISAKAKITYTELVILGTSLQHSVMSILPCQLIINIFSCLYPEHYEGDVQCTSVELEKTALNCHSCALA